MELRLTNRVTDSAVTITLSKSVNPVEADINCDVAFIENGWYGVELIDTQQELSADKVIELMINGQGIECRREPVTDVLIFGQDREKQLFLLNVDYVQLGIRVDGSDTIYRSAFYLCLCHDISNYTIVKDIVRQVMRFEDEDVNRWIFHNPSDEGVLKNKELYRTVESYIALVKEIAIGYEKNAALFKKHPQYRVIGQQELVSYDEVRHVSGSEFRWLLQNLEQLAPIKHGRGVEIGKRQYLPSKMMNKSTIKSRDTYENRMIIGFLGTVIFDIEQFVRKSLDGMKKDKEVINQLAKLETDTMKAPGLVLKEMQWQEGMLKIAELEDVLKVLHVLYNNYQRHLTLNDNSFTKLPRKTKVFQEIRHYADVYRLMIKWFAFGEVQMNKEEIITNIKTMDTLYELYCLMELLKMLKNRGFSIQESTMEAPIRRFEYPVSMNDSCQVSNTFCFTNASEDKEVSLYYQPVIYSHHRYDSNGIGLFRTNHVNNYYVPDFVIKMSENGSEEDTYAIFDAKFSDRRTIHTYYLNEAILKYTCGLAPIDSINDRIVGMWLLQGRSNSNSHPYYYYQSPLAQENKSIPSIGIGQLNPLGNHLNSIWDSIT